MAVMHRTARILTLGYLLGHLVACKHNDDEDCYFPNGEIAPAEVGAHGTLHWLDGDTPISCTLSLPGANETAADTPGYSCSFGMSGAFSVAIRVFRAGSQALDIDVDLFDVRTQTVGPLSIVSVDATSAYGDYYGTSVRDATVRKAAGGPAAAPDFVTADFEKEIHLDATADSTRGHASLDLTLHFTKASFREGRSWACGDSRHSL